MDPQTLKYAKSDEWVHVANNVATVGITDFAVKALTDLVYIDLPKPGKMLKAGEPFGVVESVKAASDMYSPVTGVWCASRLEPIWDGISSQPYVAPR